MCAGTVVFWTVRGVGGFERPDEDHCPPGRGRGYPGQSSELGAGGPTPCTCSLPPMRVKLRNPRFPSAAMAGRDECGQSVQKETSV